MSFWSKCIAVTLVVLIGVMTCLVFVLNQGVRLQQTVDQYPADSTSVYLYGVPENRSATVMATLAQFAGSGARAIVRVDQEASNVDGSLSGLRVGMVADPRRPPSALDLEFLGTTFIDGTRITKLLASTDPAKSIGLDANTADVIVPLPNLLFAPRLSVVNLGHLVDTSGTINGTYRVVGASPAQTKQLLSKLATASGQSASTMLTPMRGQETDSGLLPVILLGCVVAASILLLLVLVVEALRSFTVLGVHLLVGKSSWRFAVRTFRPVILETAGTLAISVTLTIGLARGFQLNQTLLAAAWSCALVGVVPVLACVAIGIVTIGSTKPVNAIFGRYSKRALLLALAGLYVVAVAGFSAVLLFIDGPIQEAGNLADASQTWESVSNEQILYHMSVGDDEASFTGQSSQLARDFFDWYASIANEPGVSLSHTNYYNQQTLNQWANVYKSVPTHPFWYVAASPSSLRAEGFHISEALLQKAQHGERVFLIPDTWTATTQSAMRGWLTQDSRPKSAPSIRTNYFDHERLAFQEYSPRTRFFSWSTAPSSPHTITDPVILVTTPANMIPFESESLSANGLENSYVKLSHAAAQKWTSTSYLAKYHLDDNRVQFLPVKEFIAGLTKTIQSTLILFGGVVAFLLLLLSVTLAALLRLFAGTYREALAVKRMLGYSLTRLFTPAVLVVGGTGILAITCGTLAQSKSAIVGSAVLLALEALLVVLLIRRYSRLQLSTALKE